MTWSDVNPPYRIETERLVLRCWDPADAPMLKEAIDISLDHLRPWMPWARHEPEELSAKVERLRRFRASFDLNENFLYGIFNADESQVLGGTGLATRIGPDALEIGYWIRVDQTNRGLATEASAALTRAAFELYDVRRVEIRCHKDNVRSFAVPRKLGFEHEGTLHRHSLQSDGVYRDTMIWALARDAYARTPAATARLRAFDAMGTVLASR